MISMITSPMIAQSRVERPLDPPDPEAGGGGVVLAVNVTPTVGEVPATVTELEVGEEVYPLTEPIVYG